MLTKQEKISYRRLHHNYVYLSKLFSSEILNKLLKP